MVISLHPVRRRARLVSLLAPLALAGSFLVSTASAQVADVPARPVPVVPPAGGPPSGATLGAPAPLATPAPLTAPIPSALPPAMPPPPPPPPGSSPLAYVPPPPPPPPVDPGPNGWGPYGPPSAVEGPFVGLELWFVKPIIRDRLVNDIPGTTTGFQTLPLTSLPWTVSPLFEVGWRMPDSQGYFTLDYRFMVAEGNETQTIEGDTFHVRTRLNLNTFDLDYGTAPYSPSARWYLTSRLGIRFTDIFYDSAIQDPALTRQMSNNFVGAGPHARGEAERQIGVLPGFSLYGRLDGAVVIGQISQHFREDDFDGTGVVTRSVDAQRRTQAVPVLQLQAGFKYCPPALPQLKLWTGYLFEQYWYLGQLGMDDLGRIPASRGELRSQGLFFRASYDF